MITINGVKLPDPSVYRVPRYDLDSENSGRNERGVLIRDRLREGMYKVELEWWNINKSKATQILNAVKPAKVTVTFLTENGYKTKSMYVGDRSMEMTRYMGQDSKMAWTVRFNLTEY